MAARRFNTLRITLLAALGASMVWGCGDDDSDDDVVGGAAGSAGRPSFGGDPGGAPPNGGAGASIGGSAASGGSGGGTIAGLGGAGDGGLGFGGSIEPPKAPFRCTDPTSPINGFVRCREGWLHRVEKAECPIRIDSSTGGAGGEGGALGTAGYGYELCARDSDCTAKPYGHCERETLGEPSPFDGMVCSYGCRVDEDCKNGEVCLCGDKAGTCVPAHCQTNADCGDFLCAAGPSFDVCGGGPWYEFACQTPNDECITMEHCSGGAGSVECVVDSSSRRCEEGAVCGRPFLVSGTARTATLGIGAGWAEPSDVELGELDECARADLERHWTRIALMEHASVAAFARFTLELLALGAPSDLVTATQRAMGDEIAHAQACFGLATAYARRPVGPGTLAVQDALSASAGLSDIVRRAFLEACVGETVAAAEATAALEAASDARVRAVLERVVRDETRHAELGWTFLRWALATTDGTTRAGLREELSTLFAAQLSGSRTSEYGDGIAVPGDAARAAHGLLPEAELRDARRAALEEVVAACAHVLGIDMEQAAA